MEEDSSPSNTWKGSEITHQTMQLHGSKMDHWGRKREGLIGKKEEYWKKESLSRMDPCDKHIVSALEGSCLIQKKKKYTIQ